MVFHLCHFAVAVAFLGFFSKAIVGANHGRTWIHHDEIEPSDFGGSGTDVSCVLSVVRSFQLFCLFVCFLLLLSIRRLDMILSSENIYNNVM